MKKYFVILLISSFLFSFCSTTSVLSCAESYEIVRDHYNSQLINEVAIKKTSENYGNEYEATMAALDFNEGSTFEYVIVNIEDLAPTYMSTSVSEISDLIENYEDNLFDKSSFELHPNIADFDDVLIAYEKLNLESMKILNEMDAIGELMVIEFMEAFAYQEFEFDDWMEKYLEDFGRYNLLGSQYEEQRIEYLEVENSFYEMNTPNICDDV
ncbi:MAG: hypothetical protein L7S06_04785 [Candidatus Actinomarina sp.]|nr:hypothetical protein [Candidatus Actinomarina sp.]